MNEKIIKFFLFYFSDSRSYDERMLTQLQLSNEILPLTVQPQSTTNCSSEHMNWNLVSVGSFVCRICHHSDTSSEPLVSPCR